MPNYEQSTNEMFGTGGRLRQRSFKSNLGGLDESSEEEAQAAPEKKTEKTTKLSPTEIANLQRQSQLIKRSEMFAKQKLKPKVSTESLAVIPEEGNKPPATPAPGN